MFELVRNNFVKDGVCEYRDEFGNRAILQRNSDGFKAKIYFKDNSVKAKPLQINVLKKDSEEQDGAFLRLTYQNPEFKNADFVTTGAFNFTAIIQHWIEMLHDIAFLGLSNEMLKIVYADTVEGEITDEDCALGKLQRICVYDELKSLIESVMSPEDGIKATKIVF